MFNLRLSAMHVVHEQSWQARLGSHGHVQTIVWYPTISSPSTPPMNFLKLK